MSKKLLAFLIASAVAIIAVVLAISTGNPFGFGLAAAALFTGIVAFAQGAPKTTSDGVMAVYSGLPWWVWLIDALLIGGGAVLGVVMK